jgi:SRSO17 transposase
VSVFSPFFKSYRHNVSDRAAQYIQGLMQESPRKNCERMAEVVPQSDDQALQQFISDSKWDADAVMDAVALRAAEVLGNGPETVLILDECGIPKKGDESAGVGRQWLGSLGKVDNGQVGVFAALARGSRYALTHGCLFLPEHWATDPERCKKAKIPEEHRVHRSKDAMALDLVLRLKKLGVGFGWVVADAGYGRGPGFCLGLAEAGCRYVVDLHSDFRVYLSDPAPKVPRQQARGRMPERAKTRRTAKTVRDIAKTAGEAWLTRTLREGTQGDIQYQYHRKRVWIWQKGSKRAHEATLVVRRSLDGKEIKYALTNAPDSVSLRQIAHAQGQRYWIERAFQDAKQNCGMGDYQVRSWVGWHHHMALVMMAQLFGTEFRIQAPQEPVPLSSRDIEVLLSIYLPRRDVSPEEIMRALEKRHAQRAHAIDVHARKRVKTARKPKVELTE